MTAATKKNKRQKAEEEMNEWKLKTQPKNNNKIKEGDEINGERSENFNGRRCSARMRRFKAPDGN